MEQSRGVGWYCLECKDWMTVKSWMHRPLKKRIDTDCMCIRVNQSNWVRMYIRGL